MDGIISFPDIALVQQLYIPFNMLFCTSKILERMDQRSQSKLIM